MSITSPQFEARSNEAKREGFRCWMSMPITKALISALPPSEHLEIILKSCFEAGFSSGSFNITVSFLEHVMKSEKNQ